MGGACIAIVVAARCFARSDTRYRCVVSWTQGALSQSSLRHDVARADTRYCCIVSWTQGKLNPTDTVVRGPRCQPVTDWSLERDAASQRSHSSAPGIAMPSRSTSVRVRGQRVRRLSSDSQGSDAASPGALTPAATSGAPGEGGSRKRPRAAHQLAYSTFTTTITNASPDSPQLPAAWGGFGKRRQASVMMAVSGGDLGDLGGVENSPFVTPPTSPHLTSPLLRQRPPDSASSQRPPGLSQVATAAGTMSPLPAPVLLLMSLTQPLE